MVTDDGRGFAQFVDRCCFLDRITGEMKCETQQKNVWLTFLYVLLTTIRFAILAFGPLLFLSTVTGLLREEFPYSVELKDPPLIKNVVIYRKDADADLTQQELKVIVVNAFCMLQTAAINTGSLLGSTFLNSLNR